MDYEYVKPEIGDIFKDWQDDHHVLVLEHRYGDIYTCLHLETSNVQSYGFWKETWGWIKMG